jgi:cellulose biosynthesis protein BcsQ
MSKRINLILNGKGGVGKSFFAVNFVQFLKDRNVEYSAYDCDNENSTLKRFHADVEFFNLEGRRALDPIFRSLEKSDRTVRRIRKVNSPNPVCRCLMSEIFIFLTQFMVAVFNS